MIGVNKPFDKGLHTKNDPKSRRLIKDFFAERGLVLIDHPNKYDIDLISEDGIIRVEVEHRLNWVNAVFPYAEINVPERKAKFFAKGKAHYCILSKEYEYVGFISAEKIQKYIKPRFLKESSNRFVKENEFFYKVPKEEFEFYQVTVE